MDLTRTWYLRLPCEPFLVLCHLSIGASPGLPTVLCVLYAGASPWFFASLFRGQGSPLVICYPFSLKLFVSTSFSSSHIPARRVFLGCDKLCLYFILTSLFFAKVLVVRLVDASVFSTHTCVLVLCSCNFLTYLFSLLLT